jgi:hypothetical protein
MIIKIKDDPEILSKIDLTKDIIICHGQYKELDLLKMTEVYDIDYDIFIKNIHPIKSVNVNNFLRFEYSPNIKISTPINIKFEINSNVNNMKSYYSLLKTPILIDDTNRYFVIYKNIKITFKHIDSRVFSKFNGNIIPTGEDLATFDFIYRVVDSSYEVSNNIYIIQNSIIYDNFPNFG